MTSAEINHPTLRVRIERLIDGKWVTRAREFECNESRERLIEALPAIWEDFAVNLARAIRESDEAVGLVVVPREITEDMAAWKRVLYASRELLSAEAPHTCPAPIHGMTKEQIEDVMRDSINEKRKQMLGILYIQECARVAHRLAQPTPAVDPDKEAKALAWLQYQTEQSTSGLHTFDPAPFKSDDEIWGSTPEPARNGWRAVAAAKAGKGE